MSGGLFWTSFLMGASVGLVANLMFDLMVARKYRALIRKIGDENIDNMRRLIVLEQQLWVARRELATLKGEPEPPHPLERLQ
jgi:hypothetical protein